MLILESAVFYAQYQNSIKFEVRDSLGQIIDDTIHAVYPGKQRLTLNFEIPAGQSMRLGIGTQGSFLYRNRDFIPLQHRRFGHNQNIKFFLVA